mgnify:CR=1 FL=1
MIRVAAFDIGKVLLEFDYGIFVRNMAPRTGKTVEELDQFLNSSPLLAEYESGAMDSRTFYEAIQQATGFEGNQAEFAALFEDIFEPIDAIIEAHRQLVDSGLPTYTLSNTNEMAVQHMAKTYDFWPRFSGHVLSYEAKSLKPDSVIYEVFEQTTGCTGEAIVYLDDRPENIAAARERGWQAIQHVEPASTLPALAALGLPVNS